MLPTALIHFLHFLLQTADAGGVWLGAVTITTCTRCPRPSIIIRRHLRGHIHRMLNQKARAPPHERRPHRAERKAPHKETSIFISNKKILWLSYIIE
jgi:hypothetical protein